MYSSGLCVALITGTILSMPALAADADQIAPQATAPLMSHTQNVVFDYSARKLLGYVSEARVALDNEHKEEAAANVDYAMKELNSIRNTRDYLDMMGIHFGRVVYGQTSSYYIPVADDTYAVRTYVRGPFWSSSKTTAVRDVELVNVDIAINPDKATERLQAAQQKIASGDYSSANNELKNLLEESIHETASAEQPFTRLQDNIYLTRVLLRQQNYDGARYTLRHAKEALSDYEKTLTTADNHTNADNLRQEIDALDTSIQRHDVTLMKDAANKVEQWWADLKTWTKQKIS